MANPEGKEEPQGRPRSRSHRGDSGAALLLADFPDLGDGEGAEEQIAEADAVQSAAPSSGPTQSVGRGSHARRSRGSSLVSDLGVVNEAAEPEAETVEITDAPQDASLCGQVCAACASLFGRRASADDAVELTN